MTRHLVRVLDIVFSLGLVLLIEKLKLDPRLRYLAWFALLLNEVRAVLVVAQVGLPALRVAVAVTKALTW